MCFQQEQVFIFDSAYGAPFGWTMFGNKQQELLRHCFVARLDELSGFKIDYHGGFREIFV